MQASQRKLVDYISSYDNIFDIPPYQRSYTWGKEEVILLLNDLEEYVIKQKFHEYYVGNIIVKKEGSHIKVVDGQQRITTLIILSKVFEVLLNKKMKDCLEESRNEEIQRLIFKIKDVYKVSNYSDQNKGKIKLNAIKDIVELNNLLEQGYLEKNSSFKEVFDSSFKFLENKSLDEILSYFSSITKMVCAVIELSEGDNEHLIFESINSKGKSLSQADLIKNFIFYISDSPEIYDYYNNVFLKNFSSNSEELDFYRQFECCVNEKSPESKKGRKIYESIKKYYKLPNSTKYKFDNDNLTELKKFLSIYKYVQNLGKSKKAPPFVQMIVETMFLTYFPWIYQIIRNSDKWLVDFELDGDSYKVKISKENEKILFDNIKLISTYHIKRIMNGYDRVEATKTIPIIEKEIKSFYLKKGIENYTVKDKLDFFYGNLVSKKAYKVPRNFTSVDTFKIYEHDSTLSKGILWLLENNFRQTEKLTWDEVKDYEIEHIFPQSPDSTWNKELTNDEIMFIRENQLDSLGNLTLLDDDSNKTNTNNNYGFKRPNFLNSRFYINRSLGNTYSKWDEKSIKNRTKEILDFINSELVY